MASGQAVVRHEDGLVYGLVGRFLSRRYRDQYPLTQPAELVSSNYGNCEEKDASSCGNNSKTSSVMVIGTTRDIACSDGSSNKDDRSAGEILEASEAYVAESTADASNTPLGPESLEKMTDEELYDYWHRIAMERRNVRINRGSKQFPSIHTYLTDDQYHSVSILLYVLVCFSFMNDTIMSHLY